MTTVAIAAGILLFNAAIYGLIILIGHALGPPVRPLRVTRGTRHAARLT